MAKKENQKLKMLYLLKIFMDKTDDEHKITMPQIISYLKQYDIDAERKSIYTDIEWLREFGIDIIGDKEGKQYTYHVGSRDFELAELKVLVDSVQASKFITAKKSTELIKKIERLASEHEAKKLNRQVYVSQRIKTPNEMIFYNVDSIHTAIAENTKVRYKYFQWNTKKEIEYRKNGEYYEISPWALCWDDENYYMIGYDSNAQMIKHYRVDKMMNLELMDERREGEKLFKQFDMGLYAKKTFGMFDGEEKNVKIRFENGLAGVVIDRFGKNTIFNRIDDEHFSVNVNVAVSQQFFGWIMALGGGAVILEPEDVVERIKAEIKKQSDMYVI